MPPKQQRNVELDKQYAAKVVTRLMVSTMVLTALSTVLIFMGFTYVVVLVVVSLVPAVVATVVDRRPKRWASRTVVFFNIAGLLPSLFDIFLSADPDNSAMHQLSDPYVWLMVYGFAGFGWVVVYIIPQVVFLFLLIRSDHTIAKLESKRQALVDEWGDRVRGGMK